MTTKSEGAFRTISEVSKMLDVPAHVLRFWETRFSNLAPMKRNGGRRYYRPDDVALLVQIRDLLYRDGYTIKGAQKFLSAGGVAEGGGETENADAPDRLKAALQILQTVRGDIARVKAALGA